MGRITFITGGARSGKSTYAEKMAKESGKKITYVATSIAFDEGMKDRIKKHQQQRPREWATIEKYCDFHEVIGIKEYQQSQILLVDCITVMICNLMMDSGLDFDNCSPEEVDRLEKQVIAEVEGLLLLSEEKELIIVSNELGMGLVPAYKMGSYYRDIAGRINQLIASKADNVFLVVSGLQIKLK